jgi:histidine triad (HIT) family protein
MAVDPDCIFCKIVAGTIPCVKLYEDDKTLAFLDINPVNKGHALVIPKTHARNLFESSEQDLAAVMVTTRRVAAAINDELKPYGMNLLQANGPGAAQSVFHFHMHIIPRVRDDDLHMNWKLTPADKDTLGSLAQQIKKTL